MSERTERLKVDVDTRLTAVWALVWESRLWNALCEDERLTEQVGAALRAAYCLGYRDALREDSEGRRGELARANGYAKEEAV